MDFIRINNLNFKYDNNITLSNLNLNIKKREFISLIGPSGCGKSTLIKILAKILTNYSGNIFINNVNLKSYKENFAYMPQNHLLLPWKTVIQNLYIPLQLQGKNTKDASNIIYSYLEEFKLLNIVNHYPHQISGGQKQRIALLRSSLVHSNCLLLDEPFSQLDAITKINLQKFLHKFYKKYNYTVIFVTHDVDEAILLSNTIYIMNKNGSIERKVSIELPSNRNEFTILQNEFLNYKKNITKILIDIN